MTLAPFADPSSLQILDEGSRTFLHGRKSSHPVRSHDGR